MHLSLPFLEVSDLDQVIVELLQLLVFYSFFFDPFFIPGFHDSSESCWVVEVSSIQNKYFFFFILYL